MKPLHLTLLVLPALSTVLACGSTDHSAGSDASSGAGAEAQLQGDAGGGGRDSNSAGSGQGGATGGSANIGVGAGGASAGTAGATGGAGGQAHAGSAGQNTGGASQSSNPACVKPAGPDVLAEDYTLPAGCLFRPQYGDTGFTITDETAFKELLGCQSEGSSGIDFTSKRLRVSIYPAAGAALRTFAVESSDSVLVGLSATAWCGGAAPPSQVTLSLLPPGPKLISESLCTSDCNFGGGGFPP